MRPTISEQLAGIRRILDDAVAPEVTGAYPTDMLRGVLATLDALEHSWMRVGPFLAWDNEHTAELLGAVAPVVDHDLASHIDRALKGDPVDALDVDALDRRNTELRTLLAAAVPQLASGGAATAGVYADVRAHLRERIARFPLSVTAPMPGAQR